MTWNATTVTPSNLALSNCKCEHAVGELVANISKGFEHEKYSAGIFLDLSKAFDTLEHNVVYLKLEKYGLRGTCLDWFKSYLSDRTLLVSCKSGESGCVNTSDIYSVEYGTPQGSCLGPLIFLIFCNDLQKHLIFMSCIQFADDTTLYITHKNLDYIRFCIETDLSIFQDWFIANKLTLNVGKSVCILFSRTCHDFNLNLWLGNEIIPQAKCTKFLGMWIDQSLSWSDHIVKTILKLKSRTNLLYVGKKFLTQHALQVLYFAQIHSVMTYGIVMWGSQASQTDQNKLQRIQNRCICIIDKRHSPTLEKSFQNQRVLRIDQIIDVELAKLWHKLQLNLLPRKLAETMSMDQHAQSLQKLHGYCTRFKHLYNRPLAQHVKYQNIFLVEGIKNYSKLPKKLLDMDNYSKFCRNLKKLHLTPNY